MSEPLRVCLVGSTGMTGSAVIDQAVGRTDLSLIAIARRQVKLPKGARMVMVVSETAGWADVVARSKANVLVCALGTTWRKAGKDEAAFRAVDYDLVLACAQAAKAAGIGHMIAISSVGADTNARTFYLRVKGEVESALGKLGFRRLDIVRPGLLRGERGELRLAERIAMWLSPVADLLLHGKNRKYRSIQAGVLADAILVLSKERAGGRFVHEHDAILYARRRGGG